ncbi:S-layer homology domain-containing protein [Bacillus hominis]|uniref:S-layer homology domain-containing protein n=1 Tax=Bacillus hominis TaxID=2817478 RepID=A0ABT7R4B2_9BACI|nr:S-layer homology domain-containing protein [Bacillus hominis]MDM5192295.1 S-layer homology domain-containing protein [Bacillus hominis]MDM5432023.1 S-layer homology domain-containing protein [Bacillus hominis]MDM5437459.1 S-layer homology domain-containing protein [Bacillus hominis]
MAKTNSYKKLIAGTMTAAMVAGVVSPVAAAGKTFPDVPAKFWAEDSINYLVEKGAVKGTDTGLFEPGKEITRAEAATMMAQILNLPIEENAKPSYPDAQEGWAVKYIAAVEKAGVVKGKDNGKFDPNGKIDRVSMASMLVEAYKLDTKVTGTPETKFPDLEKTWGKAKANILVELGISAGTTPTTWEPEKTVTKAEAAQFIAMTDKQFGQKAEAKVESIKAINAKEIEVKFGAEVKDVTAANFAISQEGMTFDAPKLSKDKKSVILTVAGDKKLENKEAYVLTVQNVKTVDGKDVPKKYEVIFFNDEVAPTVSTVSTPDGDVKVVFSEKLSAAEVTVVINGKEFKAMPVDNTVTVSKAAVKDLVKNGEEFSVIVNGAKDFSNNAMSMYQGKATYKVEKDTTAPEVKEVKVTDIAADEKVTLEATFSEELAALNTITVKKGEKTLPVVINENADKTKATFTVDGAFEKNENTANLSVEFVGHKDAAGNVGTKTTKTVQVSKDVVAPKFTKVETDGLNAKLVFDKKVNTVDAKQLRAINLDTSKEVTVEAVKNPANEKEVTLTFPEKGNYQLFVNKGFAVDTSGNKSAAFDTTAKVAEKDVVGKEAPTATAAFNANKITVDFSKAVKGGQGATSASNVNNYTLDGKKLPEGTIIVLDETGKKATIELPASTKFDATKTVVFTVANVESTDNVKIKNTELLVKVLDNTAPVFQSAKITSVDNKEITLTFSEAVKVDTNDFVLDLNGAPLTVAVKEEGKVAKDVVLKVTSDVNLGNGTVTVQAKQGAENTPHVFTTADQAGNKLVDFKSVTAAK